MIVALKILLVVLVNKCILYRVIHGILICSKIPLFVNVMTTYTGWADQVVGMGPGSGIIVMRHTAHHHHCGALVVTNLNSRICFPLGCRSLTLESSRTSALALIPESQCIALWLLQNAEVRLTFLGFWCHSQADGNTCHGVCDGEDGAEAGVTGDVRHGHQGLLAEGGQLHLGRHNG